MSSNDRGDVEPESPTPMFLLEAGQFGAIFQVTHQLPNFQQSRLDDQGFTSADLGQLIAVVGSIQGLLGSASRVLILASPDREGTSIPISASVAEVEESGVSIFEVRAILPQRIAAQWHALANFVVSSLGQRELFLRTGYSQEEIQSAIGQLAGP